METEENLEPVIIHSPDEEEGIGNKPTNRPRISDIWENYQKSTGSSNMARCNYCLKLYSHSGNTSNLRKHMMSSHPERMKSKKSKSESMQQSDKSKECSLTSRPNEDHNFGNTSSSIKSTSIDKYFAPDTPHSTDGVTYQRFMRLLQQFFVENYLAFNIVDSDSFHNLVKFLNKRFVVPSRKKLTTSIDSTYIGMSNLVRKQLEGCKYFSLTMDAWTDPLNTVSYLGVTIHFFRDGSMNAATIATIQLTENHTASYLENTLKSVLEKWNINLNSVVVCVTDGASNFKKAAINLFGASRHLHCFAHILNLVAQDALKDPGVKEKLEQVKKVVAFFKRSVNAAEQLRKEQEKNGQESLKLIQSCPTRWNSTYLMLERYLKLHVYVAKALMEMGETDLKLPSKFERDMLKECTELLAPLLEATTSISAEKHVAASKIIPVCKLINLATENVIVTFTETIQMKSTLLESICNRLYPLENVKILNMATTLDPRFKVWPLSNVIAKTEAIRTINCEIQQLSTASDKSEESSSSLSTEATKNSSIWDLYDSLPSPSRTARSDVGGNLKHYLDLPATQRNSDPSNYWVESKKMYPALSEVALKYITIMGSSVPSERLFSKAGNIITKKRNRLDPKRAEKLIFLSSVTEKIWAEYIFSLY